MRASATFSAQTSPGSAFTLNEMVKFAVKACVKVAAPPPPVSAPTTAA